MLKLNKNPIFRKTVFALICCWVLVSNFRLPFYVKHSLGGFGWDAEGKSFLELQKEVISLGLAKWVFTYLFAAFFSILDLIVIMSIFTGFFFGLKSFYRNKNKFLLFVLPPLIGCLGSFITLILGTMGGAGIAIAFAAAHIITYIALPYLFFSFVISLIFYFRKENFLKRGMGILFLIVFIGLVAFGKYGEVKGLKEKGQVEMIEESILKPLLEKAIENKNSALCEELNREMSKIKKEVWWVWLWPEKYYNVCIKEVAKKLGNESLCEKIGDGLCKQIVVSMKNFLQSTDLCKEYLKFEEKAQCIKEIALATNNAELCAAIYDVVCVKEIAIESHNPRLCDTLKEVRDPPWAEYSYSTTAYREECYKDPDIIKLIEQVREEKKGELPDLIIKDFYYDGRSLYAEYCNIGGSGGKGNFLIKTKSDVGVWDGNPSYPFSIPDPGECKTTGGLGIGLIGVKKGDKKEITKTIDWQNRVKESNEENNSKTKTIEFY